MSGGHGSVGPTSVACFCVLSPAPYHAPVAVMAATDAVITTRRIVCLDIANLCRSCFPSRQVLVVYNLVLKCFPTSHVDWLLELGV